MTWKAFTISVSPTPRFTSLEQHHAHRHFRYFRLYGFQEYHLPCREVVRMSDEPQLEPAPERVRRTTRRPTLPTERNTGRVQDRYSAYDDFPWESIQGFLRTKWPYWENFNPRKVSGLFS